MAGGTNHSHPLSVSVFGCKLHFMKTPNQSLSRNRPNPSVSNSVSSVPKNRNVPSTEPVEQFQQPNVSSPDDPPTVDTVVDASTGETIGDRYYSLEEIPEPLEYRIRLPEEPQPVPPKPPKKKKTLSPKQLEVLNTHRAPPFQPGQSGNPLGAKLHKKNIVKEIGERVAEARAERAMSPKMKRRAMAMGFDVEQMTILEALMVQLATSPNPQKVALFLERTYGKVPNVNLNAQLSEDLVRRFKTKLTDSELEAIAEGADVFEILLDKLPDVDNSLDEDGVDTLFIDATSSPVEDDDE